MGKKQTTTQNQTTSTAIDPFIQSQAYYLYQKGSDAAANAQFVPLAGPVSFTPDQQKAFDRVRQQAEDPIWKESAAAAGSSFANANNVYGRIADWRPETIESKQLDPNDPRYKWNPVTTSEEQRKRILDPLNAYTPLDVQKSMSQLEQYFRPAAQMGAAQVDAVKDIKARETQAQQFDRGQIRDVQGGDTRQALDSYLNAFDPSFYSAVLNPTLQQIERQRQISALKSGSEAAQVGAFGGSRLGVMEAETNRAALDAAAKATADVNMARLNTALGALQSDFTRGIQAGALNQSTDYNTLLENARLRTGTDQFNSTIDLDAQKANQGANLQRNIANANLQQDANRANFGAASAMDAARANAALQTLLAGDAGSRWRQGALSGAEEGMVTRDNTTLNSAGQWNANRAYDLDKFNIDNYNWTVNQNNANTNAANITAGQAADGMVRAGAGQADLAGRLQTLYGNDTEALLKAGGQQQGQAQSAADIAQQNAQLQQLWPVFQAMMQQGFLNNTPYGTTTTSSGTSETKQNVGLNDILGAIMGGLAMVPTKSDERLKKNIRPIEGALGKVRKLEPTTYEWKDTGRPDAGLIAQSVQRAQPDATLSINGDLHYQMPKVVGLLAGAVQELDRKVSGKKKARK